MMAGQVSVENACGSGCGDRTMVLAVKGPAWAIDVKVVRRRCQESPGRPGEHPWRSRFTGRRENLATSLAGHTSRADPEKRPVRRQCHLCAKALPLEAFGRQEAAESKNRKRRAHARRVYSKKVVDMPNMEVEVQLCGDDEYFAEKADIVFQQKGKISVRWISARPDRGRKTTARVLPTGPVSRRGSGTNRLTPMPKPLSL